MDTMTLPKSSKGNKFIITLQDHSTKWVEATAVLEVKTATVIAWLEEVFSRCGVPKTLVSDRGSQFESSIFAEFLKRYGIEHHRTTAYRHQGNGMVERLHRTLWDQLKCKISKSQKDWDIYIPEILFSYRSVVHRATGISPAEAFMGHPLRISLDNMYPTKTRSRDRKVEWMQSYAEKMKQSHDTRKNAVERRTPIGTKVLVNHPTPVAGKAPKLNPRWKGPFLVVENTGTQGVLLEGSNGQILQASEDQLRKVDGSFPLARVKHRGRSTSHQA